MFLGDLIGILDARLCPVEGKYLFIMSGNSEESEATSLLVEHLKEVISLWTFCFWSKSLFMPCHVLLFVRNIFFKVSVILIGLFANSHQC